MSNDIILLNCWAFGDDDNNIIPVKISRDEPVGILKEFIRDKKHPEYDRFPASNLTLFKIDVPIEKFDDTLGKAQSIADIPIVQKLHPADELADLFRSKPDRSRIHILIQLPEQEHAGRKRKLEEDILERIEALREEIREDKKATVSISRITQNNFTALLDEHGLCRKTVKFNVAPTTKLIKPFTWGDKKEDAYADEYLEWLTRNINLPHGVEFCNTSSTTNLLSTTLASSRININGTFDTAIVDHKNVESFNIAGGVRVGLEHKKKINHSHVMQAITELIAINIFSEYPAVIVLTDLNERWQFFWLERGCVVDCVFDLKKGITLLETIAQQPTPPVDQSTPDAPYLQRCNFRIAVSQARESGGAPPEDTEVEGLERLLQRPKVDIMGLLPEDDVADMRDVFDVMTPKEIREWQMRRVLNFAMQTPAVQSSVMGEDWRFIYA